MGVDRSSWRRRFFSADFAWTANTKKDAPAPAAVYLKLCLTAIFWGGTFIAGRVVGQYASPFSSAFLRFAIASACLLYLTKRIEGKLPKLNGAQCLKIFLLGMSGVFAYNFFFFKGLQIIEAGRASVIIANNPIIIALLSAYWFKERLTPVKMTGILLSISGAVFVITRGDPLSFFHSGIGPGEACIFGSVASWVAYSLIGKTAMKDLSPLVSVAYSAVAGAALLFIPACMGGLITNLPGYPVQAWAGFVYLGVFGTVLGFVWYYEGIRTIGPTRAGQFINIVPLSAIGLAFVILGEPVTWSLMQGGVMVVTGVYLANRRTVPDHTGSPAAAGRQGTAMAAVLTKKK